MWCLALARVALTRNEPRLVCKPRPSISRLRSSTFNLPRPLPRRVKHPQDFHRISSNPIRNEVRRFGNDQLPRPWNSPSSALAGFFFSGSTARKIFSTTRPAAAGLSSVITVLSHHGSEDRPTPTVSGHESPVTSPPVAAPPSGCYDLVFHDPC